ncbi:type II secretion system F family protein [Candidatus Pacearchaeota archaeon]|nr:type II secretion system F family protein [Candidatus Pacearchaeota archaeon]
MKFKIPFSRAPIERLSTRSKFFKKFFKTKKTKLSNYLEQADLEISREDYLGICLSGFFFSFIILFIVSSTIFVVLKVGNGILYALGLSIIFSGFVFFSRLVYPKVFDTRKQKNIERNLIPALQDMHVQLSSGIPLFSILVNISSSDYEELSGEFQKIVKKINAGYAEMEVLEEIGEKNSSPFFRRALWQISNGMKAGGDITIVIEESIKSLSEEQLIQIQEYGNKLNPTIMFYMLISVIIPALSITFLTVISSLVNMPANITTGMFVGLFLVVMVIQIMFLGVIKSIRPSLL